MATTTYTPRSKEEGKEHLERAKEAGSEALKEAKDAGAEALNKAKEAGKEAFAAAKDAGADALGKAREAAASVGAMATETAAAVGKKADDWTAEAGHGIGQWGQTMARKAPHEGIAGAASQAIAEGIKGTGRYIEEHKLSGMAHDVEQLVKNHPLASLLICFGIGYCVGRTMRD